MGEFRGFCKCDGGIEKIYQYSCLMAVVNGILPTLKYIQDSIDAEDVYKEPGYGLECKPHVSVLYGFHDDKMNLDELNKVLSEYKPFEISLTKISCFENIEFDVLKFEVKCETILEINKRCRDTFEHTLQYPYNPHITIAFLKKGTAKKYVSDIAFSIDISDMVYSRVDGTKIKIQL